MPPPDARELVPYAALACDPARASEVAFVFHESEAFFGPYQPHGGQLLIVDGSCRYHVFDAMRAIAGVLRTGALTPDELDGMNAELLTAPWAALDGQEVSHHGMVADAPMLTLRRASLETRCNAACPTESLQLELVQAASAWIDRLWDRATPLDGAVDVVGERATSDAMRTPVPWTGAPLEPRLVPTFPGARIDDPAEAAMLRALRDEHSSTYSFGPPLHLIEGDTRLFVGVADVLPYDLTLRLERGGRPWAW